MSEVPPPTRRARKDTAASSEERTSAASGDVGVIGAPDTTASGLPVADTVLPRFDDDPERMPTAQLEMAAFGDHLIPYVPPTPPPPPPLAPWGLALSILALLAALFTGWLLPLGVVAVVVSVLSLRRPLDSRRVAGWALALSVLSLAFSVGWLVWGFSQLAVV